MHLTKLILAASALALSGCAGTQALDAHSANFGDAVAQNIAAQRVVPTEAQKNNTFIPPNQARQKAAREAYEKGEVKALEPLTTTNAD